MDRFRNSREIEFYDRIRFDINSPARGSYANYLVRDYKKIRPQDKVLKIELISATIQTPPPDKANEERKVEGRRFFTLDVSDE